MLFIICQQWHFILKVEALLFVILTLQFLKAPPDYNVLIHSSADCKSLFLFQMLWVQRIAFSLVLWKRWKALLQEWLLGQIRRAVPRLQWSNRHRPHHGKQMRRLRRPSCLLLQLCVGWHTQNTLHEDLLFALWEYFTECVKSGAADYLQQQPCWYHYIIRTLEFTITSPDNGACLFFTCWHVWREESRFFCIAVKKTLICPLSLKFHQWGPDPQETPELCSKGEPMICRQFVVLFSVMLKSFIGWTANIVWHIRPPVRSGSLQLLTGHVSGHPEQKSVTVVCVCVCVFHHLRCLQTVCPLQFNFSN